MPLALTYRLVKGSNLTATEVDNNFHVIDAAFTDLIANPLEPNSIASITADGLLLILHMTDATTFTVPIPFISLTQRGAWLPFTLYSALDAVTVDGVGGFEALIEHTSGGTFNPDLMVSGAAVWRKTSNDIRTTKITTLAGTTYTLTIADAEVWLRSTNASPVTITVPPNATVAFGIGTTVTFEQGAAGAITVAAGSGVTLNVAATHTRVTRGQFAVAQIKQTAANVWTIFGNLVPA